MIILACSDGVMKLRKKTVLPVFAYLAIYAVKSISFYDIVVFRYFVWIICYSWGLCSHPFFVSIFNGYSNRGTLKPEEPDSDLGRLKTPLFA